MPTGTRLVGRCGGERLLRHPREPAQDRARPRAAVVRVDVALLPERAGQVLDADGEVVDVDLEPDGDDAVGELERLGGPPDAARVVALARLAQQVELDQLADEARDGAAREARLRGDAGARARRPGRDLLQDDAEVGTADGRLVGPRGRALRALEAHAHVLRRGDVGVDSITAIAQTRRRVCMGIAQTKPARRRCQRASARVSGRPRGRALVDSARDRGRPSRPPASSSPTASSASARRAASPARGCRCSRPAASASRSARSSSSSNGSPREPSARRSARRPASTAPSGRTPSGSCRCGRPPTSTASRPASGSG